MRLLTAHYLVRATSITEPRDVRDTHQSSADWVKSKGCGRNEKDLPQIPTRKKTVDIYGAARMELGRCRKKEKKTQQIIAYPLETPRTLHANYTQNNNYLPVFTSLFGSDSVLHPLLF